MTVTCGMCPCYVCASWQFFLCIFYATFLFISLLRYFCFASPAACPCAPITLSAKWWMKECELWMPNEVNGQAKKNNGKCCTKTRTVAGTEVMGSVDASVDSQGPLEYECGRTSELRLFIMHCVSSSLRMSPLKSLCKHFPSAVHYANKKLCNLCTSCRA